MHWFRVRKANTGPDLKSTLEQCSVSVIQQALSGSTVWCVSHAASRVGNCRGASYFRLTNFVIGAVCMEVRMADIPAEPKMSAGDYAYGVVKAAVSAVPVAGGPASELLGLIFGPPLEKRRGEWLNELADAIREIQGRVAELTPEKLSQNEAFVTTALHASQIAIRTHQRDKRDALRNAVVSAALPDAPDETLQQIFLNYVESLTGWHLRILAFFADPRAWGRRHNIVYPNWTMGSPAVVLETSMRQLAGQRAFYDQIFADLDQRGLVTGGVLHTSMTSQGMFASRTTNLGDRFLRFIAWND